MQCDSVDKGFPHWGCKAPVALALHGPSRKARQLSAKLTDEVSCIINNQGDTLSWDFNLASNVELRMAGSSSPAEPPAITENRTHLLIC